MEGYVDTSRAERAVWLMKWPAVISRSLHSINNNNNLPVAKVVVSINPLRSNDDDSTQFNMELTGTDLGNVPMFYSMDMSKDFVPMSVFSESQGKISVEGKIFNKSDIRPHYEAMDCYAQLCCERTKKYMTKTRQIQERRKQVVKASEPKRTRRDRGEMEEIMFKLFYQQPNWTLKELIHKTDQPEELFLLAFCLMCPCMTFRRSNQFMEDLLKDLCVYNKKGAKQGTYELKPEYKKSIQEPSGS